MMYRVEHTDTPLGRNQLQFCCLQPSFRTAAASVVVFDDTPAGGPHLRLRSGDRGGAPEEASKEVEAAGRPPE